MSPDQRRVLSHLNTFYHTEEPCRFFSGIAKALRLEKRLVRLACRALARKGFTKHSVVFDWDGMVGGSAYFCTDEGHAALKALEAGTAS